MVKPGGTGRPRLAISARPAPLPPKRLRILGLPSARPPPKAKTHLPFDRLWLGRTEAFGLALEAFRATGFFHFALTREVLRLTITQRRLDEPAALKSTAAP